MTTEQKLELILSAVRNETEIEVEFHDRWHVLHTAEVAPGAIIFKTRTGDQWGCAELFEFPIRKARSIPLLSDDDYNFLRWFDKEWWITRDDIGDKIYISDTKPQKEYKRAWHCDGYNEELRYHPPLTEIRWDNEDSYTIAELIERYLEELHNE